VVEDCADKMPYPFTGTLKKYVVVLEPAKDARRREPTSASWPQNSLNQLAGPPQSCLTFIARRETKTQPEALITPRGATIERRVILGAPFYSA
jgi:hypothetical protein